MMRRATVPFRLPGFPKDFPSLRPSRHLMLASALLASLAQAFPWHAANAAEERVEDAGPAIRAERAATPADYGFPAPNPRPGLPSGFDTFSPPYFAPSARAPKIAAHSKTAGPDESFVVSGSGFGSARFRVFGQRKAGSAVVRDIAPVSQDGIGAAAILSAALPGWSTYLVWPRNGAALGKPVAINRTEAWWAGPQPAVPGGTLSVYGRNLSNGNAKSKAWIYVKPVGGRSGRWLAAKQVNPYKVDFAIPSDVRPGSYEIWAHNGHGGHFGWSEPIRVTVSASPWAGQAGRTYNVRDYGARGNGSSDDQEAIQRALEAAARSAPATVYFPAGTYMVSRGFIPPNRVRWLGAGSDRTIIRANSSFRGSESDPRTYALIFGEGENQGNNIEFSGLTFDQNGHPGRLGFPVWLRWVKNVKFTNAKVESDPGEYFNFQFSEKIHLTGTVFVGSGGFLGDASQVFIKGSTFLLTNNANAALTDRAGEQMSIIGSRVRDLDSSRPEGSGSGRFFVSNSLDGSTRHLYFAGNRTIDLAPPAQDWSGFDTNAGEQILFEQCCSGGVHSVASAGSTHFTLRSSGLSGEPNGPRDVMVVSGPGTGQYRRIVGYDSRTGVIRIDRPWKLVPTAGTQVSIASAATKIVVYGNILDGKSHYATKDTASTAVQLYSNSADVVIDSNRISNMRGGFELWAMGNGSRPEINSVFFNLAANNVITQSYDAIANYTMYLYAAVPNTIGHYGNIFRRNIGSQLTNAGVSLRTWEGYTGGAFRGNIYERNRFMNVHNGLIGGNLHVSEQTGLVRTVLYKNSFDRGTAPYPGSTGTRVPNSSTWITRASDWTGFQSNNRAP